MQEPLMDIRGLGKKFRIKPSKTTGEKKIPSLFNFKREDIWALRQINLQVFRGDKMAILGKNGSGKSTLFKLISEVTDMTEGEIVVRGKISSMLEVGVGFHYELTGRENVYYFGCLMGMSSKEINVKFDEIVQFAEIEKFLSVPLKRYSSGMTARLAFSVATHLDAEILLIDEVLSVCDAEFRKKAVERIEELSTRGCAVLTVSHDVDLLNEFCNRGVYLREGNIVLNDSFQDALESYQKENQEIENK